MLPHVGARRRAVVLGLRAPGPRSLPREGITLGLRAPGPLLAPARGDHAGAARPRPARRGPLLRTPLGATPPRPPNSDRLASPGSSPSCPHASDAWWASVGCYLNNAARSTQHAVLTRLPTSCACPQNCPRRRTGMAPAAGSGAEFPRFGVRRGVAPRGGSGGGATLGGARGAAPANQIFSGKKEVQGAEPPGRGAGRSTRKPKPLRQEIPAGRSARNAPCYYDGYTISCLGAYLCPHLSASA
jgi:hypothetical protein